MRWLRSAGLVAFLSAAASGGQLQAPPCDVFCHSRLADRALAAGNNSEYRQHVRAVAALAPSHPGIANAMARAFARTGAPDSAIAWLGRLGRMGDTRDPNNDSVFASLRARIGYADARNRLLANRLPILDGQLALEIDDADFLPEAVAWDSVRARFLAGSLSKRFIASIAPNGTTTSVVAPTSDILRVVGVHINAGRSRLWFATWEPAPGAGRDSTDVPSRTRLFLADLESGKIVRSWTPDGGRPGHLLNDFVVMSDGGLFITDTEQGFIYRLRSPADTLELFLRPEPGRFSVANGITTTPDGRTLYVAFLEGIARIDVGTGAMALMPAPDTVSIASIDGLYWYRGSLVAVQGIPTLSRVVRYGLSGDGRSIVSGAVLERGQPEIVEPTTGVIVGTRFYYIANSQYGRLDDRSSLAPQPGRPRRTAIRVIDLR